MSSIAYRAQPKTHPLGYAFDGARDGVTLLRACLTVWRRRVRARSELMTLSDSDLRDIRWTRAEAVAEARKPFWRA